jgi:glucose-1-phosphate cytidylyltransferase
MKAVILAGGLGTRISEESVLKPKPMIEIGGMPIIWHIMKIYSYYGINDFIICAGYKGYIIKEYFANYPLHVSDITIDLDKNNLQIHQNNAEKWRITIVDTGEDSMTGGRLRRVAEHIGNDDFCFTYGDGLSSVDINKLIQFHKQKGKLATVTATRPPGRFGTMQISNDNVESFKEKPQGSEGWINGGFFVLSPKVIERIKGDDTDWERGPMETLAEDDQLAAYMHSGFWQPMDTLRDRNYLEELWATYDAPWKVWK